jgi:heme/copper-type cytochrome/quinol oxidase subunit 3
MKGGKKMERQKPKKTNVWKIIAIVLIVLFVLENIFFVNLISDGMHTIQNGDKCMKEVCGNTYESYYYDQVSK